MLTPAAVDDLTGKGKLVAGSRATLARVGVGVMVKAGAPKPDIGSVEAFKRALLAAKSVAYIDPASGGSSGIYVAGLLDKLGIAEQVKPKAKLKKGGYVADLIVSGEAELGIHQISEIVPVKEVTLVGPLPAEIQNYTVYAGALGAGAKDAEAAKALIKALTGPAAADVLKSKGMEHGGPASDTVMAVSAKALFFDVFGTLVDWRNGIAREAELVLAPLGLALDWLAFADAWRDEYQPGMEEVRSGRIPFSKLDVLHRHNLEQSCRGSASPVSPRSRARPQSRLASARRLARRAARPGAAQAALPAGAGLERQHLAHGRSRAPERARLGRDPGRGDRRRLQAEAAGLSRRLRGARSFARRMHDGRGSYPRSRGRRRMRAAHRSRRAAE